MGNDSFIVLFTVIKWCNIFNFIHAITCAHSPAAILDISISVTFYMYLCCLLLHKDVSNVGLWINLAVGPHAYLDDHQYFIARFTEACWKVVCMSAHLWHLNMVFCNQSNYIKYLLFPRISQLTAFLCGFINVTLIESSHGGKSVEAMNSVFGCVIHFYLLKQ